MLKEQLKHHFKSSFRNSEKIEEILSGFEKDYLRALERRIDELSQCPDEQLPIDYIQAKRDILEMHLWLEIFIEALTEMVSSPTRKAMNMRLQTNSAMLDRLFQLLVPLEQKALELRAERILANQGTKVHHALETIKGLLQKASEKKNIDLHIISKILKDQETFFRLISQFFHDKIPEWEKTVVGNARGLLFSDPERFPFSAVYTLQGNLYIFLEIVGHFIGMGTTKIGCRAVKLQTGEVFALIKSRTDFAEIENPQEIENQREIFFYETVKEAKTLERFAHQQGIVQLRDRFAFLVNGIKQIFLIEDYFKNGSLEKHLDNPKNCGLDIKQKISIAVQILTGVRHICEAKYVHGDLKSANILVDLESFPIPIAAISDFNSAFPIDQTNSMNLLIHTPHWCPPELASILDSDDKSLEAKDRLIAYLPYKDIWSVGLIFYELFFEEGLPWNKESPKQSLTTAAHLKENWIPSRFSKSPFYSLIRKMTSIDPKKRPSADEAFDLFLQACKKLVISP